jgi:hypothetical protein
VIIIKVTYLACKAWGHGRKKIDGKGKGCHLSEIQTKEGVDHAFNPRGVGLGRSWCSSLARQLIHPNGGLH